MAKIVLIAETLSPTVAGLAGALRSQQHQVTVLTEKNTEVSPPEGVELWACFEKWSLVEAVRVAPVLFGMNPQVLHFVLEKDRMNRAQMALAALSKALPHCVLTTSLLHLERGLKRSNPVRYLLQESDIITCPSVEVMGRLRGLNMRRVRQGRGILPPVLNFSEDRNSPSYLPAELAAAVESKAYVVVPFFEREFQPSAMPFRRLALMAAHRHVVMLGSQSDWSLRERKRFQTWMTEQGLETRWTLTGPLEPGEQKRLLTKAEALVLAGLKLSPLEITEYDLRALQAKTTLILDDRQSTIHSELWRNEVNCWILPQPELLSRLQELLQKPDLRLEHDLPQSLTLNRDLVDAPLNELNRLYNKALAQKHLS